MTLIEKESCQYDDDKEIKFTLIFYFSCYFDIFYGLKTLRHSNKINNNNFSKSTSTL